MFTPVEDTIQSGSHVIVYSSRVQLDSIFVVPGQEIHSKFGHFRHNDMINVPYGSKFSSANGRGFVYLLKPTPELWTLALPHRTQILYLPDIAFITSYLDIKSGSKVIEAGTGSGSFSHAIARSVGSKGRVYSYEYHEERFTKAKDEFKQHKLDHIIQLKHQNVYNAGFELENEVDAIFLDLPAPWDALESAKSALRKDRQARICCFSPCIEQVLKTVSSLSQLGFSDITMYEALTRDHEPAQHYLPTASSAIDRIQNVESKKLRRREIQIADAGRKREQKELKRKREEDGDDAGTEGSTRKETATTDSSSAGAETTSSRKGLLDGSEGEAATSLSATEEPKQDTKRNVPARDQVNGSTEQVSAPVKEYTFRAGAQSRGHTSYLTFATLLPVVDAKAPDGEGMDKSVEQVPVTSAASKSVNVTGEEEDDYPMAQDEVEALLAVDELPSRPA